MLHFKYFLSALLIVVMVMTAAAHRPDVLQKRGKASDPEATGNQTVTFRENCANSVSQIDMAINNVRARLLTGGDVWWDTNDGRYVVPKVQPGEPEVSSIFAGAVWLGGVDPAGNLKVAAKTYGSSRGRSDFFSGPLNPETGKTDQATCAKWDKFFVVRGNNIREHLRNFRQARLEGIDYDPDLIPTDVKGWPGRGNPFFFDIHQFDLPNTTQGLAGFWDEDGDGLYDPTQGDFPIVEIRGCFFSTPEEQPIPDEMTFWIYNDAGNIHAESMGDPIQMEVQVQAFAYATNDEINDMTFQRYKLINRAIESIDSTFFAMWVDPDLGCFIDDYVGCDTSRSLAYVYNQDAVDGQTGSICPGGVPTYGERIPILGVDYFRGPLDEFGNEIGMSSFTYYNNGGVTPTPLPGTTDPNNALEYYRYLSGSWRDGTPFTYGGDAYQEPGPRIKYAFTEAPNDINGWSMCTEGLPPGDRRTIQASGPFRLDPGAVNELIVGVVWVPDQVYPCPSIAKLQEADDVAQALFDNCFRLTDGPDAPDLDFIELDRELIAILTNDTLTSNNAFEAYAQPGLRIPAGVDDSLYRFEGYKLYQLADPSVTISDLNDPDKARLIFQVDVKNGITSIYNWTAVDNPLGIEYFVPTLRVSGADQGIRHTVRIREDQFATGNDRRLINHKKYYFTAIAYAFNEYEPFDPKLSLGQRQPYLEGRRNIGDGENIFYTAIPRKIVDRRVNAMYGDGAIVTRIDGIGNGGNFLDLSDETREAILQNKFTGEITYRPGRAPIEVQVFNPLDVVDGEFELTFFDENMNNQTLDQEVRWQLKNLSDPNSPVIFAENTIERLNEQIIKQFGFSVTIGQVAAPGANPSTDPTNGAIGFREEYPRGANAEPWLRGIPDDAVVGPRAFDQKIFNFVLTGDGELDQVLDPNRSLTSIGSGYFAPYYLANWRPQDEQDAPFLTPAWTNAAGSNIVRQQARLADLNNVDIVFTPNKDLWSRCVVIETANRFYDQLGFSTQGNRRSFDLRAAPSVTKFDNNGDGLPDIDTEDGGEGMGWFPGYAIDVQTGERLNIFFGENSIYDGSRFPEAYDSRPTGRDMMFNPTNQIFINDGNFGTFANLFQYYAGGQHFVYVTKQPYDGCAQLRNTLRQTNINKWRGIRDITWAGLIMTLPDQQMRSYANGLIPEEVVVKLRVNTPYQVNRGTGDFNGYPTYRFRLDGRQAGELDQAGINEALNKINVVPNPYYGFSDYEISQFVNIVKITNLPPKCVVTIYSLDGKFIRQYTRDEQGRIPRGGNRGIEQTQILPDLEWDLRNNKGIPIASGVYLIHVSADGLGERTLKWFGINRKFDPSGL
ncbi:MAG TPA: hypothetical protein PKC76_16235 [Saprospiraceae bacterium]|mgnify:CR=1 FL=1|nr:hypothetical protein [Saprospiraceae bacterium]HMP25681.1 hypothetical protein [Saprospiraceae bacterium]